MPGIPTQSIDRPLRLFARPDLIVSQQEDRSGTVYVVKDPVSLEYFQLRPPEYAVLRMLDGRRSWRSILEEYEEQFPTAALNADQLFAYARQLHDAGLVIAEGRGGAEHLLERRRQSQRHAVIERLANPLALRLGGVDPQRLLDGLNRCVGGVFSRGGTAAAALLAGTALACLVAEWPTAKLRLPEVQALLAPASLLTIALVFTLTKVYHELAHGVCCRRMGGECHEIGVMLLAGLPCLYCDVSDAWMLPRRTQRVAIGAAGIVAELALASIALLLWLTTAPGLFNSLCFLVAATCGVATLLFNANPLMRYDGYYILADLVRAPNLAQRASSELRGLAADVTLGLDNDGDPQASPRERRWLLVYAVAALAFRLLVISTLLYLAYRFLAERRLEGLIWPLSILVATSLCFPLGTAAKRAWADPTFPRRASAGRATLSVVVGLAALAAFLWAPLPSSVRAPVVLEPAAAESVYVTSAGVLVAAVELGDRVRKGDAIATLQNPSVELEIAKLESARDRSQARLKGLLANRGLSADRDAEIPTVRQNLADLDARLADLAEDAAALTLYAPRDGVVLAAPRVVEEAAEGQLAGWSGNPLDPPNRGCFLTTGTLLCRVGEPGSLDALALARPVDVAGLKAGATARVKLAAAAGRVFSASVVEVSQAGIDDAPRALTAAQQVATEPSSTGQPRLVEAAYLVRLELQGDDDLPIDGRGEARIVSRPESLGKWCWRQLSHLFRFAR